MKWFVKFDFHRLKSYKVLYIYIKDFLSVGTNICILSLVSITSETIRKFIPTFNFNPTFMGFWNEHGKGEAFNAHWELSTLM